jgi:glycosyltransferase involved in cell wall biosynthesis
MRILSICYEYPPLGGGGAKVVAGLTRELAESGHTIDLVTMWMPGLRFSESRGNVNLIRIPCIRFSKSVCRGWEMPLYMVCAVPVLFYLCLKRSYALNHTHFILPDGVLAFTVGKIFGLPYIITAHGSDVPGYNPDRFKFAHRVLAPVWRVLVRSAEAIICPSRSIERLVTAKEPEARCVRIPNGIDVNLFRPRVDRRDRILVVTRMFERKGVQYLVDALENFDHSFEVHIVGDGPYLKVIEGYVEEKNLDVKFWGFLENQSREIRDLYETSRIFVFPSAAENFPIVLLEAMAAGLAIITTKGTGCSEVVGDAALLVDPHDSSAIRGCLDTLIDSPDLIEELGLAARKRLTEKFGWATVAEHYASLYASVNSAHE